MPSSLVPRLLPALHCCMIKMREPGKTYLKSDVAGGTDLFNSSETKSSQFHPLQHSHDKFYQAPSFFTCNIEKLGGDWVQGSEINYYILSIDIIYNTHYHSV